MPHNKITCKFEIHIDFVFSSCNVCFDVFICKFFFIQNLTLSSDFCKA